MRTARQILLAVVGFVIMPALVFGQGTITGVVKDASGAVLPGATVEASSPALIEKVRSVVTDGTGQYRIVDLRPGTYALTFTLPGFSTVRREGLELTGSFTATVNADLRVGEVAETITVTGESPTVDIQTTAKQRVISKEVIDAIPAGRNYLDAAVLLPGLQAGQPGKGNLMDVGGTNNLQTSTMTIHGGRTGDTRVLLDGLSIRNIGSEGQFSNFVPDTSSTQEVTIDYGAVTAEQPFGGLWVNHVPRDGGNRFSTSVFATAVGSSWQGNNFTDDLKARGLTTPNSLKRMYDVNPSVGGPIVADKVWFYSAVRWQANKNYVAGVYENLNAGKADQWLYAPDTSKRGVFDTTQNSLNGRVTWQANQKNKIAVACDHQWRRWFDLKANVSPEASQSYYFPKEYIGQVTWSSPLTSRLLLDARLSDHAETYVTSGEDFSPVLIPVLEQSSGLVYRNRGLTNNCCLLTSKMPNIWNSAASATYVTGAHALKIGFSDIAGQAGAEHHFNNSAVSYRFNNGVPNLITQYLHRGGVHDQPEPRAWHLRTGQVDAAKTDAQRWASLRLLQYVVSRAAPRPRRAAAEPESDVPGPVLVQLQGHFSARGRGLRPVRQRQDCAQGELRPLHPGDQRARRQPGHEPRHQRHQVVGRRGPELCARVRPHEPTGQRRVRHHLGPVVRERPPEHHLRPRGAERLGRASGEHRVVVRRPARDRTQGRRHR